jgi:hypothetical protein
MGIVKPFTKQHSQTALGADLRAMLSLKANEAMVGGKTQIGVGTRQTG